ncbi:MAG: hypothetical protein D6689_09770 [Deltaproteobacteria bacterium]|nr:MAG: hypothetical protein D6689_09770 [Deltaproteobacteria bacterium]
MTRSRAVFTPVIAAAALVAVAAGAAVYAGRAGLAFLPGLNDPQPPLAQADPVASPTPPALSERVVLVIVDGLAERASYGLPFIDRLRAVGTDAIATAHAPSISRPNYVAIVTGVPPLYSGVRNNAYHFPVRLDSIMRRLRAAGRETAYVSESSTGFGYLFAEDIEDIDYSPWPGGFEQSAHLALRRGYPLVILLPGWVDDAGHLYGAASDEYRAAAHRVDRALDEILGHVDLTRTTVIVTADHGHLDGGGHGGVEPEVLEVPLVLAGAGIRPGALIREPRLIDIAPTVAALLGVPAPGHGFGRTLVEALAVDAGAADALRRADDARIRRNRAVVDAAIRRARARRDASRTRRLALVFVAVAAGGLALVAGRRLGAFLVDWRVLAIALPAFPLTFYALVAIAGHRASLSALPDEGVGARIVFWFGLAATGVHVAAAWLALRGRVVLRNRLAAANALAWCGLFVAGVPAAMAWALYGGGPFVDLPGPRLLFLIPAMYISVACYAAAAGASLGLELVVFFARVFDPRWALRRAQRRVDRERQRLAGDRPGDAGD